MVKIRGMVFVLGVLMLSGCSAAGVDGIATNAEIVASAAPTAAAITLDSLEADPSIEALTSGEIADAESVYLGAVRGGGPSGLESASDTELVAAGRLACEQLAAGVALDDVDVIIGDDPREAHVGQNDRNVAGLASETFCIEYNQMLAK